MGYISSAQIFQSVMEHELALAGLSDVCYPYVDDLIIASDTPEEHIRHVDAVLKCLSSVSLAAHPSKSYFGTNCLEFLGMYVSPYGISPQSAKIHAIKSLPSPTNIPSLRSALGLCGYYRSTRHLKVSCML